jgi:hypothetical protein
MSPSTVYNVTNHGTEPVVLRYGGADYPLPPGQARAVPEDAVKAAVGDWETRDTENDDQRGQQRKMINVKYGLFGGSWYSDNPILTVGLVGDTIDEPRENYTPAPDEIVDGRYKYMHPNLPRLSVYDFDGKRIFTVIDDPDGNLVSGEIKARVDASSEKALLAAIKQKDDQIDKLIAAMTAVSPEAAAILAAERNTPGVNLNPNPSDVGVGSSLLDDGASDPTAKAASINIMDEELGLAAKDKVGDSTRPVKKAAAKKAATHRPTTTGDDL